MLCPMHLSMPIHLSPEEKATLTDWANAKSLPLRTVQRAQIITMAADAVTSQEIASRLDISRPTVQLWREGVLALRLAWLGKDAPRPGRIPSVSVQKHRA